MWPESNKEWIYRDMQCAVKSQLEVFNRKYGVNRVKRSSKAKNEIREPLRELITSFMVSIGFDLWNLEFLKPSDYL